ncbi:uncharacterized protein LOC123213349 [Mangifera indica]|uniref:uncharacterized protein LOC123213349 n=1 Tax=Mangifera indica TaxID=29780 RepID=UPI001CFB6673|nr:uncharacterized protein LOC123213349 [Mangifera indica]XP_044488712.1 uncharacterized protein LOC123213349 [Mangifera indica]
MVPNRDGVGLAELHEHKPSTGASDGYNGESSVRTSFSEEGLLNDEKPRRTSQVKLAIISSRFNLLKVGSGGNLPSPTAKFQQIAKEKDDISRSIPSSTSQRFRRILAKKIDWASLSKICQDWIKNPFNMALFLWIICVAVSGAILFLVMTGMLNGVLPKKSERDAWFEVNNQILNALFTLMCLYQHPKRFHHLVLLFRWNPKDVIALRKIYCKNGTYKPHEWAHMMVVVALLHLNCFAQYALCGLNLGYRRSERPAIGVGICLSVAIAAPAVAGVYSIVSPLGKEYDSQVDPEAQDQIFMKSTEHPIDRKLSLEKRFSFASKNEHRTVELAPAWRGNLFDIWDDIAIAYLSVFCSFCVLGWNLERLGFGNMYVHIATFLLFCTAPFWIFNLAAVNIDNETVREALGLTGVILCIFGVLYGGFWRIQMRKRFNLPSNNSCCGKPAIADCAQWLFCCWCSLAQEVRTADYYEIVEDKFCRKQTDEHHQPTLSPLPREDGSVQHRSSPTSPIWDSPGPSRFVTENSPSPGRIRIDHYSPGRQPSNQEVEYFSKDDDNYMKPPIWPSMLREDNSNQKV